MLRVPKLECDLIDIAELSRDSWQDFAAKLSEIAKSIASGSGNKSFNESRTKLLAAADGGDNSVDNAITSLIDIRACAYLWLEDESFLNAHPVNSDTLQRFKQIINLFNKSSISYLSRLDLIQLFFKKFETCGDLKALIKFLHSSLEPAAGKNFTDGLEKLRQNKDKIINKKGYKKVADKADNQNRVLETVMQEMGIDPSYQGRFTALTNGYHYLKKLKKLAPKDDSLILKEVSERTVATMSYEGRLLGHFMIEALSDNAIKRNIELPEKWLQTILSIACDPRNPETSADYQRWWAKIAQKNIEFIRQSLSGFDLKLFLEVLEDFTKTSDDGDDERMFPKRKKFLEGLLEQKLIRNTRLFISNQADEYLKRNYPDDVQLPHYARVSDRNTSIIYLQLKNVHIVEGSHTHRFGFIRVYQKPRHLSMTAKSSLNVMI